MKRTSAMLTAHDPGGAEALDDAGRHQHRQRAGERAGERRCGEQRQPDAIDSLVAEDVAEGGQRQQGGGDGELVAVGDEDRGARTDLQVASHQRQGDVDDGAVEHRHRHGDADRQHRPQPRPGRQAVGHLRRHRPRRSRHPSRAPCQIVRARASRSGKPPAPHLLRPHPAPARGSAPTLRGERESFARPALNKRVDRPAGGVWSPRGQGGSVASRHLTSGPINPMPSDSHSRSTAPFVPAASRRDA